MYFLVFVKKKLCILDFLNFARGIPQFFMRYKVVFYPS